MLRDREGLPADEVIAANAPLTHDPRLGAMLAEPTIDATDAVQVTGGEAVVRSLERHGVRHVFGIPGDHTIPIYAALGSSTIQHCTVRHEQSAGFMADGYARASGRPGVAIVIGGPGLTNIATAMGEAYADGVPLLVISADTPTVDCGAQRDHNHEMKDQLAAAAAICGWSERIGSLGTIPDAIDRAFSSFRTERARSIHIGVPIDILSGAGLVAFGPLSPSEPAAPDPNLVTRAAALLRSASRPVLLVGGGVRTARSVTVGVAEALGTPVMTTWSGTDAFPNDHPLHVGGGFHLGAAVDALADADVVLAVGTQLGRSDFWHAPPSLRGHIIRVDIDGSQLDLPIPAELGLVADARLALNAIRDEVGEIDRPGAVDRAAQLRTAIDREADLNGLRYKPWLQAMRAALPADAIIAADSTLVTYRGSRYLPIPSSGAWLYPNAFGTLGYALPAAIGAQLAQVGRPAAVLIGDGGFLFTCAEVLTATEQELGLPIVIWNDRGYGCIREGMRAQGVRPLGVDFAIPDLAALARAFGGHYAAPRTPAMLAGKVRDALARRMPTLIEVDDRDVQ